MRLEHVLRFNSTAGEWGGFQADYDLSMQPERTTSLGTRIVVAVRSVYDGVVKGVAAVREVHDFLRYYRPLVERLVEFQMEHEGWDGEGSVPASDATIDDIVACLTHLPPDVRRPSAAMGSDGSVALVWQDDEGRYVTTDFGGTGTYAFLIDDRGAYRNGSEIDVVVLPDELQAYLCQHFPR